MMLQGMKRYRLIYVSTAVGLVVNAVMDIPMILLLNKLNWKPYLGTLMASTMGFTLSIIIIFVALRKRYHFRYVSVRRTLARAIITSIPPVILMLLFRLVFFRNAGYLLTLVELGVSGAVSMGTYLFITYRMGIVDVIFGKNVLDKLLVRLHLKRD